MTGTSYQAPIVLGSQMLVLTDEAESVFLFQSQKEAPVAGLFEDKKGASAVSSRPYGFALADAFLVASQAGLQCYTIDPLATKAGRKRDLRWEHRWQSAENTPTQPLQVVNNHVAAVVQHPDSMGITVDLVAAATGQLVWRTRIAAKGTNVWLPGSRDLVDGIAILQDDAANWFNLRSKAEEVEARLLEHPPVPAAASWSAANSVWWWADAVARKMFCGSANGTIQPYFELFETPASPISVRDAPSSLLAWVTEAQNVAVCHPTRDGRPITIPLERGVPAQDWFQPLWLSTNVVLCGHPAGFLARVEVDEHNEQLKLSLIQRALGDSLTTENGTFAAVAADGNLVIATSAELVLLDCETLRLRTRLPLPASASTSPVGRTPLGIGLQNGTLVLYDPAISSRKRLVRLFTVPVVSLVAHAKDKLLYAVSASGEIATVGQDGNVLRRWTASAPLALPPFFCGRQLLVATEAGSLEIFNRHEG